MSQETMPVGLLYGCKGKGERFPMSLFRPHEEQAQKNHYQSLDRLAERGGLDWSEALAILKDREFAIDEGAEAKVRAILAPPPSEEQP
jgi:hypothetical protein